MNKIIDGLKNSWKVLPGLSLINYYNQRLKKDEEKVKLNGYNEKESIKAGLIHLGKKFGHLIYGISPIIIWTYLVFAKSYGTYNPIEIDKRAEIRKEYSKNIDEKYEIFAKNINKNDLIDIYQKKGLEKYIQIIDYGIPNYEKEKILKETSNLPQ